MKNKFNIGDRVMIRTDLEVFEKYGELTLLDSMAEHCGTISEIAYIRTRVNSSCCYILKGVGPSFGLPWLWSEEMLADPMTYLCGVKIEKASKDSAISNLKVGIKIEKASKKPKFKKGDSVKVAKQFADVKTGYYQVLDVLYINEKSWYTLKGAPMIWVPEENLEMNDNNSVKENKGGRLMKLETLANIINNLWQDEDVNGIVVRLKWQDITYQMVLDCRDMATCDSDQIEFAINDTITKLLKNIMTEAQCRFTDSHFEIGPGIKYVGISKSYLDPKIMECRATLEGGFGEEEEI